MYRILTTTYSALMFLLLGAALIALLTGESGNDPDSADAIVGGSIVFAIVTIVGLSFCVICLKKIKIFLYGTKERFGLSFDAFHEFMESCQIYAPRESRWIVRLDQPLGLIWIIGGAALFLLGAGLHDLVTSNTISHVSSHSSDNVPSGLIKTGTFIEIFGAFCVVRGRAYFLPTADVVLALDKRAPILYLRSFLDDKPGYSEMMDSGRYLDRSLEMKLAKYFNSFGPFVAVGSKKGAWPRLGAVRVMRPDPEWQSEVTELMDKSRAIVAAVGTTPWIRWELSEIIRRKYVAKTLFIVPFKPQFGFGSARRQGAQHAERIQVLNEVMPRQFQLKANELGKNECVIAFATNEDGGTIITLTKPTSNGQFLGAIIGHYLLMNAKQKV